MLPKLRLPSLRMDRSVLILKLYTALCFQRHYKGGRGAYFPIEVLILIFIIFSLFLFIPPPPPKKQTNKQTNKQTG